MARIGRVVAGGFPHHITQRGNRRQKTFFCNEDYELYIKLMAEWCTRWRVEVIRFHERIGRPLGNETFIEYLEIKLNRPLRKRKPGPKITDAKS